MPTDWLLNCFNTIQKPNTFKNRNVIRYNLRIITRIFRTKIGRKIRLLSLGRKKRFSLKKKVDKLLQCLGVSALMANYPLVFI